LRVTDLVPHLTWPEQVFTLSDPYAIPPTRAEAWIPTRSPHRHKIPLDCSAPASRSRSEVARRQSAEYFAPEKLPPCNSFSVDIGSCSATACVCPVSHRVSNIGDVISPRRFRPSNWNPAPSMSRNSSPTSSATSGGIASAKLADRIAPETQSASPDAKPILDIIPKSWILLLVSEVVDTPKVFYPTTENADASGQSICNPQRCRGEPKVPPSKPPRRLAPRHTPIPHSAAHWIGLATAQVLYMGPWPSENSEVRDRPASPERRPVSTRTARILNSLSHTA